jgi:hypothetical protein
MELFFIKPVNPSKASPLCAAFALAKLWLLLIISSGED